MLSLTMMPRWFAPAHVALRRRCQEKNQGAQTPHRDRHARQRAARRGAWCRCSGPQRCARSDRAILQCVPTITRMFADGGYAGQKIEAAVVHINRLTIEILKRSDLAGFIIVPRRWVFEHTLAWHNRCRLDKDWKVLNASSEAWMGFSSIRRMTSRIAKLEL